MTMGIKDDINRILRDHEGYTGDGRGGVGDLPIGDRSTARKPISKRDLREVLGAVHDSVADPAAAAMQAAEDAEDAADRAELAAAGVEYPVSYAPQTLTAPQRAQARSNIGAVAMADLPEVPVEVPLGTIMHFAADTPPTGWLVCDGTAVTALYPDLRAFLVDAGSPYGASGADPLLPDLRGEFLRGWDSGRGVDPGRMFGSAQLDQMQQITGALKTPAAAGGNFADSLVGTGAFTAVNPGGTSRVVERAASALPQREAHFDSSNSPGARTGSETRPRNVALLPCIRAYASVVNVPGQADLDNILQQTQVQVDDAMDRVVGEAETAAMDRVAWKRVGKVPVGTGAAVTLTGLDLTKETLFILSYVKCSSTSNQTLRVRASEDGGATWLTTSQPVSASANWSASILRGALELFPDPDNNRVITGINTAAAAGGSQHITAPIEFSVAGAAILLPSCDTIEISWSGGNFAASGASAPETDCIIVYQRG